jgi:monofunctional biosynthetic peptidoglycan transglycosylase
VFLFIFSIFSVAIVRWLPVRYTPLMLIRYMENIGNRDYRNIREWTPIDKISDNMVMAVIAAEDNMFMTHCGIDWDAIKKAIEYNKANGTKIGASTITQQTAKNVYLLPSRTWSRKALEVYFTFLIEIFWSKKRIMEVYLNIVEVGNGMYGVETAAKMYFGKTAANLSIHEAAQIASILPNPRIFDVKKPSKKLREKQTNIERQVHRMKPEWKDDE